MALNGAKRLAGSLFGKAEMPDLGLGDTGKVLPLRPMMERLLSLDREAWGLYAWSREPLEGKFDREQKLQYQRKAEACGREEAVLAAAEAVLEVPDSLVKSAAASMKLQVTTPDTPVGGGQVTFAQYVEPDEVTIFMDAVEKAEALAASEGLADLLGNVKIFDILLAHEIFHAVEFKKENTIYTKTERVELWRKPFSNKPRLVCLGEMAGMAFAEELLKLPFSPYVLDVLLMYGYHGAAATALFEEIMEIAGENGGKVEEETC